MAKIANEIEPLPLEDLSSVVDADRAMSQAERATELRQCMDVMLHVYKCENAECTVEKCSKVKKFRVHIESHFTQCTPAVCMRCQSCKYLIFLAALHARSCTETECPVPMCIEAQLRLRNPRPVNARVASAAMARVGLPALGPIIIPTLRVPPTATSAPDPRSRRASVFTAHFNRNLEELENRQLNNHPKVPQCSVCMEDICESCTPTATPCGHVFCERCINDCLSIYDFCPKCQKTIPPGSCIKLDLFDRQPS